MRYIWSILGFFLSGFALFYFAQFIPAGFVTDVFNNWQILALGSSILVLGYFIRGYKTCLLLSAKGNNIVNISGSLYISIALNNILPFRLGDILRIFYLRTALQIDVAKAMAALIIERLLDLIIILSLFIGSVYLIDAKAINTLLDTLLRLIPSYFLLAISVLTILGGAALLLGRRITQKLIFPAFIKLHLSWSRLLKLLIATCLQWLIEIVLLSLIISHFIVNVPAEQAILSAFMSNLATLIPSAPGYIGTFEVIGLVPFQLSDTLNISSCAFFVLMYHLTIWCFSTALGLLCAPFFLIKRYTVRGHKMRFWRAAF